MQTIEINTTQNVVIQYEMAGLKERILAFFLDSLIIWSSVFILAAMLASTVGEVITYIVTSLIFFFYTLVSEIIMDGQTIGKKALKIKVIKLNGKEPVLSDYLLRWVFRIVDIYFSLGTIASILISSSDKGQRIGDMMANTVIIKTDPTIGFGLNDILKISSLENYNPEYPEARKLSEESMLLVQNLLHTINKHPNKAHGEALTMLVDKLCSELNIEEKPKDKKAFLKTLLKDYVVLTR
ncbi:RDD family protein [Fulvivirgaceae bacterium BMA10]|uniref:RDD family protein n=1 Tax=Splendidivirga corallicola TaxID=3051826 RepID=A0ABT8KZB5_9BACT|nr:RDD family protein [Fulvivirgaceae bacterium BMA10]